MAMYLVDSNFFFIQAHRANYPFDVVPGFWITVKNLADDKAKYTDWSKRADIKAELKVDLILLLAEHDYPL